MKYTSTCIQDTYQIAAKLAATLRGGEVVLLCGDLGSGKTTFVKGLAHALGIDQVVTSPTFTLMNTYQGTKLKLYHFDLYRLGAGDAEDMGFDEFFHDPDAVCCIEWSRDDCYWGKVIRIQAAYGEEENSRTYSWED
ncbi:MAG: tRNA (adenosine(37)-N6)-threonylcarbamoyltransferase complex ATPase subunit type 1 TsaE [Clostridia bacterium]|nr:tRNA (adenosine(37)-N6)-threonylcarbamoyltransferase complex ATPase subunit type 1 TsaE [Clostridia bacterium]